MHTTTSRLLICFDLSSLTRSVKRNGDDRRLRSSVLLRTTSTIYNDVFVTVPVPSHQAPVMLRVVVSTVWCFGSRRRPPPAACVPSHHAPVMLWCLHSVVWQPHIAPCRHCTIVVQPCGNHEDTFFVT
uniref:Uncharacterized protein n=1 Tax=Knipowitschia caucasica TaxID=637954 RepID=A0AAV2LPU1_KNICA